MSKFSILWFALAFAPIINAQVERASIIGNITDKTGAAMPGVKLSLTSLERDTSTETTTNATGNYELAHLLPGRYRIRAEAQGFKLSEKSMACESHGYAKCASRLSLCP